MHTPVKPPPRKRISDIAKRTAAVFITSLFLLLGSKGLLAEELYLQQWLKNPDSVQEGSFTFSYDRPQLRGDEYFRFRCQGADFVVTQGTNRDEVSNLQLTSSAQAFGKAGSNYWIYSPLAGMLQTWTDQGKPEEINHPIQGTVYSAPGRFHDFMKWGIPHLARTNIQWNGLRFHGTNATIGIGFAGNCTTNSAGQLSQINADLTMRHEDRLMVHQWEIRYAYANTERTAFPTNIVADLIRDTGNMRLYSFKDIQVVMAQSTIPMQSFLPFSNLSGVNPRFSQTLSNDSIVVRDSQGRVTVERRDNR